MQSKRDQVQAHSFVMSRLTSGMLLADPDAPESPLGRTTRGVFFGLLLAVIIAAGAVVYGLLRPGGNDSWRDGGTLVVNNETGGRYLYLGGELRPVLNYASARLIGGADMKTTDVGSASLRDTPVGAPVGIPGAPDSVPAGGELDAKPWHVCVTGPGGARETAEGTVRTAAAEPGATTVVTGAPLAGRGVGGDRALVVRGPDKKTYLVWRGSRLAFDEASDARQSMGYGSVTPQRASAAFLDALAPGPGLAPPAVPGRGSAGPELGGGASRVGQVFRVAVPGGDARYYLLQEDGLTPLTETGAALVLGDPATKKEAYEGASPEARTLGADALAQHQAPGANGERAGGGGLPAAPPRAAGVPDGSAVCARVRGGGKGAQVTTVMARVAALGPVATAGNHQGELADACMRVDATVVRPGRGSLVRALSASGADSGTTTYLVAENGVKHRVPSKEALGALGYTAADVGAVPAPLLSTLPTGADLDRGAASGSGAPRITASRCGGKPKETDG